MSTQMFRAEWDGICAECGLDWDAGDLVGYLDGVDGLLCDACWNEGDLEAARAEMTAGGLVPGPLPGGIEKPSDVRKPKAKFTAGADVCPRCRLIKPCDCEEIPMDPALQAIIDAAAAKLAAAAAPAPLPAPPPAPAVSPELQAIIDAAAAKLAPAPEPSKDPWSGLTPELQAIVDAAKASLDPLTAPPVETRVEPPVETRVEPPVETPVEPPVETPVEGVVVPSVEDRQGEIILNALGLTHHGATGTLEAALDALAPYQGLPERGMEAVVNDLMEFLVNAINNQERSQQRTIGPSEIGIECDHCLAAKLAGWREKRDGAWLPTVGTAVHEWIEKKFREAMLKLVPKDRRYLTELKVFCGYINGEEIWGSVDIVDLEAGVAGDWKIVGITTLKDIAATEEPSTVYKIQRQIYLHGLNTMGIRTDRGVIGYLPRNSPQLSDAVWPHEEYRPEVAIAAMERADTMARMLAKLEAELGAEVRDAHISLLPRQRGKDGRINCYSCKRYDDFPAEAERLPVDHTFGGLIGD